MLFDSTLESLLCQTAAGDDLARFSFNGTSSPLQREHLLLTSREKSLLTRPVIDAILSM